MFDSLILFILCHFRARSLVWLAQTGTISQQAGTARFRCLEENTAHGAVGRIPVGYEVWIHPTWNQASQSHPAWEVASAWKTILGACSLNITRLDRTSVLAKMNKPGSLCSLGMVLFVYLFISSSPLVLTSTEEGSCRILWGERCPLYCGSLLFVLQHILATITKCDQVPKMLISVTPLQNIGLFSQILIFWAENVHAWSLSGVTLLEAKAKCFQMFEINK